MRRRSEPREWAAAPRCFWTRRLPQNLWLNTLETNMGIVREPNGVDLIVASGRWSREESAEAAIWLAGYRQGRNAALSPAEIANAVRKLPSKERSQLIQQLTKRVREKAPTTTARQ